MIVAVRALLAVRALFECAIGYGALKATAGTGPAWVASVASGGPNQGVTWSPLSVPQLAGLALGGAGPLRQAPAPSAPQKSFAVGARD
jgi:hypothetical protein